MLDSRDRDGATATSQSAHRRHPRHHLAIPLNLWRKRGNGAMIPGIGLEISESGISVIFPEQLALGETVEFAILLPGGELRAAAVVRNKTMFRYGFEFNSLTGPQRQLVKDTCAALPLYTGPEY